MRLPEDDEEYLNKKGYRWDLLPDPGGWALLVIRDYALKTDKYDRAICDLMIRIPPHYNDASLDMFYVTPDIRLKSGAYPSRADQHETYAGINWQRFSRHLPQPWRAGVDTIRTMLVHADRELKG